MKSDCCLTKKEFLVAKAHNFRKYVAQYKPKPEIQAYIDKFDEAMLVPTLVTLVLPVVKSGTTGEAVDDFMKKLDVPEDQKADVKQKIVRYLEMFAQVLMS
jgi:hypothetical protein